MAMLMICVLAMLAGANTAEGGERNVRALSPLAASAVAQGVRDSPTFCRLVARLESSDVVVYVAIDPLLARTLGGRLSFVATIADRRYVRAIVANVTSRLSASQQIALLGHELAHAVEIAEAPGIVDARSMATAYAMFGTVITTTRFETERAVAAAATITRELFALGRVVVQGDLHPLTQNTQLGQPAEEPTPRC